VSSWLTALLLALPTAAFAAANTSASFRVDVLLLPGFKDTPDCGTAVAGASVSVTCATSGTNLLASPRYLLHVYRDGRMVETVEAITEPGTVTSWRVVRSANREFLEIVVGW
jgi:hypothetical protein